MKGKIKLAPNVTAWSDEVNHIYLRRPKRVCMDLSDKVDLEPIMKGVNAGYLIFINEKEEVKQVAPAEKVKSTVDVNVTAKPKETAKRKRKAKQEEPKVEEVKEEKYVEPEVKVEEQKPEEDK